MNIRWTDNPKQVSDGPRGKFPPILAAIKADQPLHPGQWAEIAKYARVATAKDTAYRLKQIHPDFGFRSGKGPDGYGYVYARYQGEMT